MRPARRPDTLGLDDDLDGVELMEGLATAFGLAFSALGAFVERGAGRRDGDVWSALVEILLEFTALPRARIGPDTLLLQSQARARRV